MTGIAEFPAPSLAAQLAELKRERQMRARVYPNLVLNRKLSQKAADYQNSCLDGAIRTLERLVAENARLREALTDVIGRIDGGSQHRLLADIVAIARAALRKETT